MDKNLNPTSAAKLVRLLTAFDGGTLSPAVLQSWLLHWTGEAVEGISKKDYVQIYAVAIAAAFELPGDFVPPPGLGKVTALLANAYLLGTPYCGPSATSGVMVPATPASTDSKGKSLTRPVHSWSAKDHLIQGPLVDIVEDIILHGISAKEKDAMLKNLPMVRLEKDGKDLFPVVKSVPGTLKTKHDDKTAEVQRALLTIFKLQTLALDNEFDPLLHGFSGREELLVAAQCLTVDLFQRLEVSRSVALGFNPAPKHPLIAKEDKNNRELQKNIEKLARGGGGNPRRGGYQQSQGNNRGRGRGYQQQYRNNRGGRMDRAPSRGGRSRGSFRGQHPNFQNHPDREDATAESTNS